MTFLGLGRIMDSHEDKMYRIKREQLIPAAEKFADNVVGKEPPIGQERDNWVNDWNFTFHTRMNELAKRAKLLD